MVLWTAGVCTILTPQNVKQVKRLRVASHSDWHRKSVSTNQVEWLFTERWWGRDAENHLPLTSASHIYSDSSHARHAHKLRDCRSIFIHFLKKTCFGACQPVKKGTEAVQFFHHNIQHATLRLRHAHEYSCSVPSALRQSIFLQYVCDKWLVKPH